ncbi:MAG TPA: PHP domain-containing protein [Oligoflexia bacterium]|nr:PHP domain-containing protein [Oligoflexia bacterium]
MTQQSAYEHLEEVARLMELAGENPFKVRAFQKGADAVRGTQEKLESIASGEVKVAGIGDGIRTTLGEFLKTGDSTARNELSAKVPAPILELLKLPGLGPKKARQVYEELGVQTLGELEYACRENRLLTLKGFGKSTQEKLLKNLELLKASRGKALLIEALDYAAEIETLFGGNSVRVGQLARHCEVVSLFEWHITDVPKKIHFEKKSEKKVFGMSLQKLEFLHKELACVLWVSSAIDEKLRVWLNSSEDLRKRLEQSVALAHEVQDWEPSWLETTWIGQTELRKPNAETYRVRRDGGVRGVFHNHTTESDGTASLEEMVTEAAKLGYQYIGISDHSQSAFYAHGLSVDRIRAQRKAIASLQKRCGIRVFHGIESDILADGTLDYPDSVLAEFDFVIGSIHSRFQMDEAAMTNRILRAMENPYMTFWGHPSGRLLLGREPYSLNWNQVFDAAKDNGVIIEFNAHPSRLDIDWRFGRMLEEKEIQVSLNPDAHDLEGLAHVQLGARVLEKAMLSKSLVFNLRSVEEVEKSLWERRKKAQS